MRCFPLPLLATLAAFASPASATNVDLSLLIDDGATFAPGGGVAEYFAIVHNAGPDASSGATVHIVFPASVSDFRWTCETASQAPCATASGVGPVVQNVDLSSGASLVYRLRAEIKATPEHPLTISGTVRSHGTETESFGDDNVASDTDTVGVFASDFESSH